MPRLQFDLVSRKLEFDETPGTRNKMPDGFTIRAGALHGPASLLVAHPGGVEKTLKSLNLPLNSEALIDVSTYARGMSDLVRLAGDDDFFVRAGLQQDFADLGLLGRATISANTLWEALQLFKAGFAYYQSHSDFVIRIYGGRCRIWYFLTADMQDFRTDIQFTMALLANVVLQARARRHPNVLVSYPGGSPAHFRNVDAIETVRDAKQGYIEFDEDLLKARMQNADSVRSEILSRYLGGQRTNATASPHTSQVVSGIVRASFGLVLPSLSDAAEMLGVGERTLQKRLREEGTTFREIVQSERRKAAGWLLRSGKSIDDTAETLGFHHRQSFSEAYSAWEGAPPSTVARRPSAPS